MADTPTAVTRAAHPLEPDPRRGLFCAGGGVLAGIVVLLVLRSLFNGSNSVSGSLAVAAIQRGQARSLMRWRPARLGA